MRSLLIILTSLLLAKADQVHLRYSVDLPQGVNVPFVVDSFYTGSGRVVALSEGGNVRKSDGKVSWVISDNPPTGFWFEVVAETTPTAAELGDFTLNFADGTTSSLSPSGTVVPTSLLTLLGDSDGSFDATRDGDGDALPLAMEYMLSLSDEEKSDLMEAFTVVPMGGRKMLRAFYQPLSGYRLALVPVLGTGPSLEPIILSAQEGTNLIEVPDLPKTFLFQARLVPVGTE